MRDRVAAEAVRGTAAALVQAARGRAHPRWRAFVRDTWGGPAGVRRGRPVVWIVCAAGGEVIQARGLCAALRRALPEATLLLSTSNHAFVDVATGIEGLDACFYTPWDMRGPVTRALAAVDPDLLVTVESAWNPVLLAHARRRRVATLLASGTMVADYHRAEPYERPLRLRVFDHLDVVGVKNAEEIEAFRAIGVAGPHVRDLGDLRLDPAFHTVTATERARLSERAGLGPGDRVLVAGSIHLGEEAVVLDALHTLAATLPSMRLVVAPRFLSAVPALEAACRARGLETRRLSAGAGPHRAPVVVVDTYGDLRALYALATWVVLGGTMIRVGLGLGQNIVEPLVHGVPVFFGPHIRRWAAVASALRDIFPGLMIRDAADLVAGVRALEGAPDIVARLRARAVSLTAEGRDAAERHVEAICALLPRAREAGYDVGPRTPRADAR